MKFYRDKLIEYRKQSHLSAEKISNEMGVCRTTYWRWETGLSVPSSKQVRKLAKILEIPVSDFSDLMSLPDSQIDGLTSLPDNSDAWYSFFDLGKTKKFKTTVTETLKTAIELSSKLDEAGIIIKALLSGIDSIFYIKNTDLVYMAANEAFLENISLKSTYMVFGKTDKDFFSKREADENRLKDEAVFISGEKSIEEGFILGTRKKRWGIITRIPVLDNSNNIAGIITNIVDITERKKLEHINEILRTCIDNLPEAISINDTNNCKNIYLNKAVSELTGFSMDECYSDGMSKWLKESLSPEDREKSLEYARTKTWPKEREFYIKCNNNTFKWIKVKYSEKIDFLKNKYIISITNDITKEKLKQKGKSTALNPQKTAAILKRKNVDIGIIAEATGLSKESIEAI